MYVLPSHPVAPIDNNNNIMVGYTSLGKLNGFLKLICDGGNGKVVWQHKNYLIQ